MMQMKSKMGGGTSAKALRASLVALVFVAFTWLLFLMVKANGPTKGTTLTIPSSSNSNLFKLMAKQRHAGYWDFEISYVSKRRVPSGPDPIHNRRAATSRQPPGRA